jgi:hypothetical protein
MARREEVCVSMGDVHARPPRCPVDRLTAVREWIWRHSSQPNGDPWDSDPEHLDWAAQNLHAPGPPLNTLIWATDRHDSLLVEPIQDSMPTIRRGGRGRPVKFHGDKDYDNPRVRRYLRHRGITARIARIGRDSSARLGRHGWVVERIRGWLLSYKRLALH